MILPIYIYGHPVLRAENATVTPDYPGLQELIEKEDKRSPLTDEQLVEALQQHGYPIARRTIAKYRDLLNIPVARLRKTV